MMFLEKLKIQVKWPLKRSYIENVEGMYPQKNHSQHHTTEPD